MASLKPGACCLATNDHAGEPVGEIVTAYGLPTYISGDKSSKKLLVIGADIYGYKYNNNRLIADKFAKAGYYVLLPDLLNDDFAVSGHPDPDYLPKWLQNHKPEDVSVMFTDYLKKAKEDLKPEFTVAIGYCFGAKFVIQHLSKDGLLDTGALAHPSFVSEEDVENVAKPILISAAQTDPIFTVELRHKTEEILIKNNSRFQIDLFSGVAHGYAVRGDLSDPVVNYAQAKTLTDQLTWFNEFAPQKK